MKSIVIHVLLMLFAGGFSVVWSQSIEESEKLPADIVVYSRRLPVADTTTVSRYGITLRDLHEMKQMLPSLVSAIPLRMVTLDVRYGPQSEKLGIVGTTDGFSRRDSLVLASGRFLAKKDLTNRNNVAVISDAAALRLFGRENPLGKNIRVGKHYFLVVGVSAKGKKFAPGPADVYIPITTMQSRFGDMVISREKGTFQIEAYELSEVHLFVGKRDKISATVNGISQLLQSTHKLKDYEIKRGKHEVLLPSRHEGEPR